MSDATHGTRPWAGTEPRKENVKITELESRVEREWRRVENREREENEFLRTLVISVVIRSISRSSAVLSVNPGRACLAWSLSSALTVVEGYNSGTIIPSKNAVGTGSGAFVSAHGRSSRLFPSEIRSRESIRQRTRHACAVARGKETQNRPKLGPMRLSQ